MKCPHCNVEIHESYSVDWLNNGKPIGGYIWYARSMTCPSKSCEKAIITLMTDREKTNVIPEFLAFPRVASRPSAPQEVPVNLQSDFNEASIVLPLSAKASAALSRRCLQGLLHAQGFTNHLLAQAIQAALDSGKLPGPVADNLDAIRNIGNYAAHPVKDNSTGQIVDVEPAEADWNLDVLEELFDYFYVQPEKAKAKRAALNAKLASTGHKPMK